MGSQGTFPNCSNVHHKGTQGPGVTHLFYLQLLLSDTEILCAFSSTGKKTTYLNQNLISVLVLHYLIVYRLTVVQVSFCSFINGNTPKICMVSLVLINGVLLNLLCVCILFQNASSHSCFRSLSIRFNF